MFDLKRKNYDDLIPTNHAVPRILIVVCIPDDFANHARWTPEQISLRNCGYWKHLAGEHPTQNRTEQNNSSSAPDGAILPKGVG